MQREWVDLQPARIDVLATLHAGTVLAAVESRKGEFDLLKLRNAAAVCLDRHLLRLQCIDARKPSHAGLIKLDNPG